MEFSRRQGLSFGLLALAGATLSACSTGVVGTASESTAAGATDSFPVTIKHAFGETVIKSAPSKVATISWVNADVVLALGVVPVGMPKDDWGANAQGSTPWKDEALKTAGAELGSSKAPVQYSETDGINFTEIAKLAPDVIMGAYSGLSRDDYDKLSKIAPVVAFPEMAYGTGWQDATTMIGKALGRSAQAAKLVQTTETMVKDKAAKYPQLAGKSFIYGNLEPAKSDGVNVYTAVDNRPKFLTSLGMTLAPVIAQATAGSKEFFIPWSAEKANELVCDVFVSWVPEAKSKDAIVQDPLLGQIPALKRGAFVADSDNTLVLAVSAASPLSLPWALDQYLPELAAAADKA